MAKRHDLWLGARSVRGKLGIAPRKSKWKAGVLKPKQEQAGSQPASQLASSQASSSSVTAVVLGPYVDVEEWVTAFTNLWSQMK